jgi:hypothetical protein
MQIDTGKKQNVECMRIDFSRLTIDNYEEASCESVQEHLKIL